MEKPDILQHIEEVFMAETYPEQIPVVDLEDFRAHNRDRREEFVETVRKGFYDIGFVFVKTPEITEQMPEAYETFKRVFELPEETKLGYERKDLHHQRGYTPLETELGINCRATGPDGSDQRNYAENWFIGPDYPDNHPYVRDYPATCSQNIWPTEVPEFQAESMKLYERLSKLGSEMLRAVEMSLGYEEGVMEDAIHDGPTSMRPLHYPPLTAEKVGKVVGACEHTDINFITALPASTKKGLWVKTRRGAWIPGMAPEGCAIVQVGDMLQRQTGGFYRSAEHKVDAPNPSQLAGRFSTALFVHPRPDFIIKADERWADPQQMPDITADDFLMQRLRDIGVAL